METKTKPRSCANKQKKLPKKQNDNKKTNVKENSVQTLENIGFSISKRCKKCVVHSLFVKDISEAMAQKVQQMCGTQFTCYRHFRSHVIVFNGKAVLGRDSVHV